MLHQIATGDEVAFRKLFDAYWQSVYQVAYMFTKSVDMAEDMVQEVFMKLWIKREQLPEVKNIRNYLFIVARNHIYNELKKITTDASFTNHLFEYFCDTKDTPEQKLMQKESDQIIDRIIEHLPQRQRVVYQLSREEGLNRKEIADKLGITPNTVRNHLSRALEVVRHELKGQEGSLLIWIGLIEIFLSLH